MAVETDDDTHGPCPCRRPGCYSERHQQCVRCGHVFSGSTIGDAHLVKKHPATVDDDGGRGIHHGCPCERGAPYHHHCLTADAMRARGWWQDDFDVWHHPKSDNPWRGTDG